MKGVLMLHVVFAMLLFPNVAFAGKAERMGGYKARTKFTSNSRQYIDYATASSDSKKEWLEAAYMAESGYPDERRNEYKNTPYFEVANEDLDNIVNNALKNNKDTTLRVYDRQIREYEATANGECKQALKEETIKVITGKDSDRLSARILKKEDGTIAVVFCGTDQENPNRAVPLAGDWRDDAKQVVHTAPTPLCYKEAAELLKAVMDTFPDTNINVYGHSEGGGEAFYAGLMNGVENGEGKIHYYSINGAGLNGLKLVNDADESKITAKITEEYFTLIQNAGDIVSAVGYQFGKYVHLDTYNGVPEKPIVNCYGQAINNLKDLDGHGIEETKLKMKYLLDGDKKDPFDSEPETDSINGQMCPIPGGEGNSGGVSSGGKIVPKPAPDTRVRRGGSGGGDTSSRIW